MAITETTGNTPVGKVFIIYGKVKAVAADGTERVLGPNSPVYANERIVTESDGRVSIIFNDAAQTHLDIGRMSDVSIDEDVYTNEPPATLAEVTTDVKEIQAALETEEFDPTVELEPPAAGEPGVADGGGGHPVVKFDLTGEEVTPDSGAETTGPTFNFLVPEDVPPLPEEGGDTPPNIINTPPEVGTSESALSEEGLPGGTADTIGIPADTTDAITASGQVPIHDADGDNLTVTLSGQPEDGALTSGGVGINWTGSGTNTLVGTAGSNTIVTITIDNQGHYTIVLSGPIDHPDTTGEDILSVSLNVNVSDGIDTAKGTLILNFEDDNPTVVVTATGEGEVILTTQDAETDGDPTDTDTAVSTADFSGVF
ncbi:MAG: retention module-containing protein, partial [Pseudomonadota bacterium]